MAYHTENKRQYIWECLGSCMCECAAAVVLDAPPHSTSLIRTLSLIILKCFQHLFTAVIGGAVVGLLCAILLVMFIVYRMRKKDEGSYVLDEPKRNSPNSNPYNKNSREFYA